MIVKWGTYSFQDNGATFILDRLPIYNDIGVRRGWHEKWLITSWMTAASKAAMTTALDSLQENFKDSRRDLKFFDDDGTTITTHKLLDADTFGGTRVTGFKYLTSKGAAEYNTRRSFQVTIEAEILNEGTEIAFYHEELITIGDGGPKDVWMPSINLSPQSQRVQQATTFKVVQRGRAIGETDYPNLPGAVFPYALHREQSRVKRGTPRYADGDFREYPIQWNYYMEWSNPLLGVPTPL